MIINSHKMAFPGKMVRRYIERFLSMVWRRWRMRNHNETMLITEVDFFFFVLARRACKFDIDF